MTPMTVSLGETIRDLRNQRNLTQNDVAGMAGVSRHTIVKLEAGDTDIRCSTANAVLEVLGMELRVMPIPYAPAKQAEPNAISELFAKMDEQERNRESTYGLQEIQI